MPPGFVRVRLVCELLFVFPVYYRESAMMVMSLGHWRRIQNSRVRLPAVYAMFVGVGVRVLFVRAGIADVDPYVV